MFELGIIVLLSSDEDFFLIISLKYRLRWLVRYWHFGILGTTAVMKGSIEDVCMTPLKCVMDLIVLLGFLAEV